MRPSDSRNLDFVDARRRESIVDEESRHHARHEEVRGMIDEVGASEACVAGALRSHV